MQGFLHLNLVLVALLPGEAVLLVVVLGVAPVDRKQKQSSENRGGPDLGVEVADVAGPQNLVLGPVAVLAPLGEDILPATALGDVPATAAAGVLPAIPVAGRLPCCHLRHLIRQGTSRNPTVLN